VEFAQRAVFIPDFTASYTHAVNTILANFTAEIIPDVQ